MLKPCIVKVLHIPFQNTLEPGALDLYFTFLVILPDAGAISTSVEFLFTLFFAGNLSPHVGFILHTVGPHWREDNSEAVMHFLVCTYINCFQYSETTLWLKSLSTPLISAGTCQAFLHNKTKKVQVGKDQENLNLVYRVEFFFSCSCINK